MNGVFPFRSVHDIPEGFWRWPHIDPASEWACKGDGTLIVVPDYMDRFEALRTVLGRPLHITSGYRSPAYNLKVAKTGEKGPHTTGRAADISIATTREVFQIVQAAQQLGFTGIGISCETGAPGKSRFIHVDDLDVEQSPRPGIWTY
jgi:hypothetical protein